MGLKYLEFQIYFCLQKEIMLGNIDGAYNLYNTNIVCTER